MGQNQTDLYKEYLNKTTFKTTWCYSTKRTEQFDVWILYKIYRCFKLLKKLCSLLLGPTWLTEEILQHISCAAGRSLSAQLSNNKIYTLLWSFSWIIFENDKIMLFNWRQAPHFSAFRAQSSCVRWQLWKEPVCWWWEEDADLKMDRVTADVLSGYHWQPKLCRQSSAWWSLLVDVFLWQLFPDGLQGSFQLISYLRLWLEFMVLFPHGTSDMIPLVQMC